eukprot:12643463-Alexandrium_andersonii.AAC.1
MSEWAADPGLRDCAESPSLPASPPLPSFGPGTPDLLRVGETETETETATETDRQTDSFVPTTSHETLVRGSA